MSSSQHDNTERSAGQPLAIVGMACRFPGAETLRSFRRLLRSGRDAFSDVPADRWDVDALYDPDPAAPGKMITRRGAFLERVDAFDAEFFGVTPREAEQMDPQQRLLAELCWEAFENAGIPLSQLDGGNAGVFVGIGASDYLVHQLSLEDDRGIDAYTGTGNAHSLAANRLSYLFNLHGPSVAMDTACSSSLVAFCYACQSLRLGDCDLAVVGGVNVILAPEVSISFSKAHMLSPDGVCRPFDADANGYVRGEGCGVVLVKRLADALQQEDRILAVVRGTAVNQDGRTVGVSAPNPTAQAAVIHRALADAGVTPQDVGYVEAHGTGTPLGDPVELTALHEVLGSNASDPCLVGSVKGNIGHLETASGVAGLIKVILMLQHREIYRQANWKQLNPQVALEASRLRICSEPQFWSAIAGRRLAGINSFGFGGTNAHVVLEEAPTASQERKPAHVTGAAANTSAVRQQQVLTISAQDPSALQDLTASYLKQLQQINPRSLADFCFNANTGRSPLKHRLAAVAENAFGFCQALQQYLDGKTHAVQAGQVKESEPVRTAFMFTGQGSQFEGMGEQLFHSNPVFQDAMEECDAILQLHLDRPLLSVLYGSPDERHEIHQTGYAQPALFALEWSLAQVWKSWGIVPDVVLGHSIGEFVAACLAEVMSLQDALWLVAQRARLMQSLPRAGAMALIFAGEDDLRGDLKEFEHSVSLAAVNAPQSLVVSGETAAVEEIVRRCAGNGAAPKLLNVSHAFHSPLMEPILQEFEELTRQLQFCPPKIPLISNLTGTAMGTELQTEAPDASYWRRHLRHTVRFADGVQTLVQLGCNVCLEVGPTPTLSGLGRASAPTAGIKWLHSLQRDQEDWHSILNNLAALHVCGADVDWRALASDARHEWMDLPQYPFRRQRHWVSPSSGTGALSRRTSPGTADSESHPLLGRRLQTPLSTTQFECELGQCLPSYLNDHQIQDSKILPAAAYAELGLAADWAINGQPIQHLENLTLQLPLFLTDDSVIQMVVNAPLAGRAEFQIYSRQGDQQAWKLNATGTLVTERDAQSQPMHQVSEALQSCKLELDCKTFYEDLTQRGLQYGPRFRGLRQLFAGVGEAVGMVKTELKPEEAARYRLHPTLLDPCLQVLAAAASSQPDVAAVDATYLPTAVRAVHLYAPVPSEVWAHAIAASASGQHQQPLDEIVEGDVYVCDAGGHVIAEVLGLQARRLSTTDAQQDERPWTDLLYEVQWTRLPNLTDTDEESALPAELDGLWLVLCDQGGVGQELASRLEEGGGRVIRVSSGNETQWAADNHLICASEQIESLWSRLQESPIWEPSTLVGVVNLWSLDIRREPQDQADVAAAQRLGCHTALTVLQELSRPEVAFERPGYWLVTQGAQSLNDAPAAIAPFQTPLWGLFRVMTREHSEIDTRIIDTDPDVAPQGIAAGLLREIRHVSAETQLAIRDDERWAARLSRVDSQDVQQQQLDQQAHRDAQLVSGGDPFCVHKFKGGTLQGLRLSRISRQPVGLGEIEMEVHSAGLNFADVLKAMDLYPNAGHGELALGLEASGRVTAIGEGVTEFEIGDAVIAAVPASFSKYVVAPTTVAAHKNKNISFEQAATIPIAFVTAYYALHQLGQLGPGQRVLIHAAAGGVGQAAVQIAQDAGAEVFATAGTDEKREFLKLQGVERVFDSRTLDFAEQILRVTEGRGVDIVLNSLAGDFITKSIECLAPFGRFLEIGKTDIHQNRMLGLQPFRNNLSYFAIDLDQLSTLRHELIRPMLEEIVRKVNQGDYAPLPYRTFPVTRIGEAFRYMAQRQNIGKVVIQMQPSEEESPQLEAQGLEVRHDGTYLLTGGLGSLGLRVAERLADRGARSLALLGRRAAVPAAEKGLQQLRDAGVRVDVYSADVTDPQQLKKALDEVRAQGPPLRGVVHAAGVLDDALLANLDWSRLQRVMAPKMHGAWNLHRATLDDDLDFFVLFSSLASILAPHGQGNYAAANAFLDGLAHYRRQEGLPALSIDWGPWQREGMSAAVTSDSHDDFSRRGITGLEPNCALAALDSLLSGSRTQVAMVDIDWPRTLRWYDADLPVFIADLARTEGVDVEARRLAKEALLEALRHAGPEEAKKLLIDSFVHTLARVIGQEPERIDPQEPLRRLGVDSLMAIELKHAIEENLNIALPLATMFEDPSLDKVADKALELRAARGQHSPVAASEERHQIKVGVLDPRVVP